MKKRGLSITLEQAQAHAAKHGYELQGDIKNGIVVPNLFTPELQHAAKKLRRPRQPNQTEREFGLILAGQLQRGEIVEYRYEGITLHWADMRYTPDYFVIEQPPLIPNLRLPIKVIEVKGPKIWDRDIVRFKGARAAWPLLDFEMWQKRDNEWHQLH